MRCGGGWVDVRLTLLERRNAPPVCFFHLERELRAGDYARHGDIGYPAWWVFQCRGSFGG